ncbi:hypothetical protein FHS00_002748 [Limimaricola variabilis]|uniref:Argininosuccinate lyase n=1 Tax=Limimaricola variabilis TaxID=1492771 RepID=A0ABR6HRJ3_9RHOB|nr:hypothetical protein [Limimaricola variabilis]MBB3713147.1 hypothetical protein [Limimaricola variabilis]
MRLALLALVLLAACGAGGVPEAPGATLPYGETGTDRRLGGLP